MTLRSRIIATSSATALALLVVGCSAPDFEAPARPLPDPASGRYEATTGDATTAGDDYVLVQEWRDDAGRSVLLLPMIHLADASFYAEVERRLADADRVLVEGVGGAPSLSPTSFLLAYVFANYSRAAWLGGLVQQSFAFDDGPRARSGDVDLAEFSSSASCGTGVLDAVALPVLMVILEPIHFGRWLLAAGRGAVGDAQGDEAAFRHWMITTLDQPTAEEGGSPSGAERLFPGVVTLRNERLLARLDETLAQPGMRRVALPWGAEHMPGVAKGLAERGFKTSRSEWLRAIAVRSREPGADDGHHLYLPYVIDAQSAAHGWSCGLVCDALSVGARPGRSFSLDLLWGFLSRWQLGEGDGDSRLSLLPMLFDRPLLFDWHRHGDRSRWRFLWFFDFGG